MTTPPSPLAPSVGVTAADSLSRKTLSLKQILLHAEVRISFPPSGMCKTLLPFQKSSDVLANELQVRSLHCSLWDGEVIFWSKYILNNFHRTRDKLRTLLLKRQNADAGKSRRNVLSMVGGVLALPMSVVTSVEASDWSVQVRTESPSLQSKQPLVRGVMAAGVGTVQWSRTQDNSTSVRLVRK